jgi:hypothetical protein
MYVGRRSKLKEYVNGLNVLADSPNTLNDFAMMKTLGLNRLIVNYRKLKEENCD